MSKTRLGARKLFSEPPNHFQIPWMTSFDDLKEKKKFIKIHQNFAFLLFLAVIPSGEQKSRILMIFYEIFLFLKSSNDVIQGIWN